ncbi:MAG: aspartate aminotransferase family protein [Acidobacteriaceae bacterium]|nr:aspartate aminotransferase family protein [Acidobacteriaceae bacterium]
MNPNDGSGDSSSAPSMSPDEFRRAAYRHADWIADYLKNVREFPVTTAAQPGELAASLPRKAPDQGEPIEKIFADFNSLIFPALTLWNHPRFFAWFSVSSSPPSMLAEFLTATLNVNAMLWKSAPAATELEQVTLSWLRDWLALNETFFGIIYDTASIGVMQAIAAAREWIDPRSRIKGMRGDLTVYISEHTHSSSEKAAIVLGFGQENVRKIPVDDQFRMRAGLLEQAIELDIAAGKRPCCIVASVGSTSTTAIDPVPAIADIADRHGIWLHVDAAYGGSAAVIPEMRHILDGAERAHSLILNPHKWLYVSIDCSVLYTRFPEILRRSASLSAEYLKTTEDDRVINYMDYGVQLGRRFRALKLWYVFRYYGRQGIIAMLRETLRLAQVLKSLVEADPDFELSAPVPLSLICFRHRSGDIFNQHLLTEINSTGKAFLSHTVLNNRFVLRFAVGNFQTNEQDIRESWALIRETAQRLRVPEAAMTHSEART